MLIPHSIVGTLTNCKLSFYPFMPEGPNVINHVNINILQQCRNYLFREGDAKDFHESKLVMPLHVNNLILFLLFKMFGGWEFLKFRHFQKVNCLPLHLISWLLPLLCYSTIYYL